MNEFKIDGNLIYNVFDGSNDVEITVRAKCGSSAELHINSIVKDICCFMNDTYGEKKFGCHIDLFDDDEPDECVIDTGDYENCVCAKEGMKKEDCKYWQEIKKGR